MKITVVPGKKLTADLVAAWDRLQRADGCIALNSLVGLSRRAWHRMRAWVRTSPLRAPARVVGCVTRPVRGWLAFR